MNMNKLMKRFSDLSLRDQRLIYKDLITAFENRIKIFEQLNGKKIGENKIQVNHCIQ